MYVCMGIYVYVCVHVYMYVYIYINIYIFQGIHPEVSLITSSVLYFPILLGVSSLLTS